MNFGRIDLWQPYPKPIPQRARDGSDLPSILGFQNVIESDTQERYSVRRVEGETSFQPGDLVGFDMVEQEISDVGKAAYAQLGLPVPGPFLVPRNLQRAMLSLSFARGRITNVSYTPYDAALDAKLQEIKRWWTAQGRYWPE